MRTAQRNLTHLILFNCVRDGSIVNTLVRFYDGGGSSERYIDILFLG